jgi:hypothetical protein
MAVLGAPLECIVSGILENVRPRLPPALAELSDESLVRLLETTLLSCWRESVRNLEED